MEQLLRSLAMNAAGGGAGPTDSTTMPDTSETVKISALALIKMLKHARSGVPLEVMGLMLGTFADEFTINVVDVFAMPQSGTSVSVESVDPAYQAKMLDLLKSTGRPEMVVGWYHSHPGFGCWLSGVDQHTQQSFETLHRRAIALVVDPVQSVKGKVMLDAFRLTSAAAVFQTGINSGIRQITSSIGPSTTGSAVGIVNGLGRKYYSIVCEYKLSPNEQTMLQKLHAKEWMDGFRIESMEKSRTKNNDQLDEMNKLVVQYKKDLEEEPSDKKKKALKAFGKLNAKARLALCADEMMARNISEQLACMTAFETLHHVGLVATSSSGSSTCVGEPVSLRHKTPQKVATVRNPLPLSTPPPLTARSRSRTPDCRRG